MLAIVSLLVILVLSIVVTRIATAALTLTGLSRELARFQARSALTGCGFTTAESEQMMKHPVRRRIVMLLMLLGNAGIVTAITSLVLAFVRTDDQSSLPLRMGILIAGLTGLWFLASSRWITRGMERVIDRALNRLSGAGVKDYVKLLRLSDDFGIAEVYVEENDWVVGRTLADLDLHAEGITVLGIQRQDGGYVGVPTGTTEIAAGDLLVLYGQADAVDNIDVRQKGTQGDRDRDRAEQTEAARLEAQETAERMRAEKGTE